MPHETTHRFLASELPVAEPESCLFHVLPVPLEATVSYAGGTARGPEAILEASDQLELWDGESVPAEAGIYTWPAVDISGSPETVLGRVEAAVGGILDCNGLPVLLGGEHTVTYGALAALKKRFGTFGIIQFDAHADLRDSYEGSPWSHACVMRRAVKDLGLPLAQFGVRAMCLDEVEARKEHGVTFHDAASIARSGLPESLLPPDFPRQVYLTFDVIMNEPVPYKGVILNQSTLFWMKKFAHLVKNHLIESDVDKFPAALAPYREELEGRSVLVKKAKPLPVECIVRGYITGSGWKDYKATGSVCGYKLPEGLLESARLEQPLFTPSTKAELGEHDENISTARAAEILGKDIAGQIENIALALFKEGRAWAESRGIIIADTKFEFGMVDGELILIDEVLTPDSSRFWPAEGYKAGQSQPSFDKQYLRDWLSGQPWDKTPPPPALPKEVVEATQNKYLEAYRILTGSELAL